MAACASLACNACPRPGRCCTGFHLGSPRLDAAETPLEALALLASIQTSLTPSGLAVGGFDRVPQPDETVRQFGLPFLPLWRSPGGRWRWWCPLLTREGRCGDYENRPALCRDYQAGTDALCAMHRPAPPEPAAAVELAEAG